MLKFREVVFNPNGVGLQLSPLAELRYEVSTGGEENPEIQRDDPRLVMIVKKLGPNASRCKLEVRSFSSELEWSIKIINDKEYICFPKPTKVSIDTQAPSETPQAPSETHTMSALALAFCMGAHPRLGFSVNLTADLVDKIAEMAMMSSLHPVELKAHGTEVVINRNGIFALSEEASLLYKNKKGVKLVVARKLDREDRVLVEVVKTLGAAANVGGNKLEVIDIPRDIPWKIVTIDGLETIVYPFSNRPIVDIPLRKIVLSDRAPFALSPKAQELYKELNEKEFEIREDKKNRADIWLVKVVEQLRDEANGGGNKLSVKEIPWGIKPGVAVYSDGPEELVDMNLKRYGGTI